ncbi:hypothetical protein BH24ACT16_BH24ACT16_14920 [soil metagenome]|jgi:uncharacterized membrane protein YdjX (TVP38/TMEM64 family)
MSHLKRITWAAGPWRKRLLVASISLAILLVLGFLLVQAIGGVQRLSEAMGQLEALGVWMSELVERSGAWAPLTYVIAKALTFITVPLIGYPLNVASGALFGLVGGVLLTAVGDTLGACTLFLLSRWAGRRTVERLAGEERMARVNSVLDRGLGGWRELLFFRVVVPIPFNLVSLAAGLAYKLRLWHFAIITFLTASPKIFTVGIGAGFVAGEWLEVAVAGGLFVVAIAALLSLRRFRKAVVRALRWRRDEEALSHEG